MLFLQAPKEDVAVIEREIKPAIARGEPDGESNTFLRKKEAQLREKREQERLERERQQAEKERERKEKEKEREIALAKQKEQQAKEQAEKEKRELERTTPAVEKLENKATVKDIKQEIQKEPEKEKPLPVVEVVDTTPKPKAAVLSPAVVTKPEKPEPVKEKPAVKERRSPPRDLSAKIPQFYFPLGQPNVASESDSVKQKLKELYSTFESGKAKKENFLAIAKVSVYLIYINFGNWVHADIFVYISRSLSLNLCKSIYNHSFLLYQVFPSFSPPFYVNQTFHRVLRCGEIKNSSISNVSKCKVIDCTYLSNEATYVLP